MEYMSCPQAAKKWSISERRVQKLCEENRIPGVSKIGYVLTDPDMLSKKQQYSSNDLILVMNKPDEQLEDQLETESRIRTALNDQLQKKEQELKRLKEQNAITVEKYLELRKELMASHHDNEKLINEMVETFSKIDYDHNSTEYCHA